MLRLPASLFFVTSWLAAAITSSETPESGPAAKEPSRAPATKLQFLDVAAQVGLDAMIFCGGRDKDHILESTGSGAAFIDYDGDGYLDVYLVNAWALDEEPSSVRQKGRNRLFHNTRAGRFEDVTDAAGVGDDGWGSGVCAGDYDGDGRMDLYVTNFGPNRLYRARGDGTFEQVAERAGVAEPGWGAGATFFDADGDGDLDLYVVNYIDCTMDDVLTARRSNKWRDLAKVMAGPFGMRGGRDRYYRNNGDGTFGDATEESGLTDLAEGYGLGVLASDLDNDGDVDLYVANDSNPNFLYRNDGGGKFTEVGMWSGAGFSGEGEAQAGMGVDAADYDGDGLQDIFVSNFARDNCTLYRNEDELFFEDVSAAAGIKQITFAPLSWGCAFFDVDHDTDNDIFVVNGHIYPQVDQFPEFGEHYRQLPILFRNDNRRFTDVSRHAGPGLQIPISARGLAVGDYDNDGDLDILVTGIDSAPMLLRNDSIGLEHWLEIRVLDARGSAAVNAFASVTADGVRQVREVRSGSTYQSQNSLVMHFGLGSATKVDKLTVRWPDGTVTERRDLHVDVSVTITKP